MPDPTDATGAPATLHQAPDTTVITGAGGWLGQALLASFTDPASPWFRPGVLRTLAVDAADAERIAAIAPNAEIVVGDVADRSTIARLFRNTLGDCDVIHAAGVIHPRKMADFERVNHMGARAVIDAAIRRGVRRMVHVSSNSPFGTNPDPLDVFRADEPFNPYLGYGQSKMNAELAVREAQEEGFDIVMVRPPWFYGPYQPLRQTTFFKMVAAGKFPLVGGGSNRRSMVYVDNLVQGVVRAELAPTRVAPGWGYWIADAEPYEVTEIVATVQEALRLEGCPVKKAGGAKLPNIVGQVAEKADRVLQRVGVYNQQVHVLGEMNKTIACDISAARRDLGYEPEVALLEGMRRSVRWCLKRGVDLR